jgi:hypothetical protein
VGQVVVVVVTAAGTKEEGIGAVAAWVAARQGPLVDLTLRVIQQTGGAVAAVEVEVAGGGVGAAMEGGAGSGRTPGATLMAATGVPLVSCCCQHVPLCHHQPCASGDTYIWLQPRISTCC